MFRVAGSQLRRNATTVHKRMAKRRLLISVLRTTYVAYLENGLSNGRVSLAGKNIGIIPPTTFPWALLCYKPFMADDHPHLILW